MMIRLFVMGCSLGKNCFVDCGKIVLYLISLLGLVGLCMLFLINCFFCIGGCYFSSGWVMFLWLCCASGRFDLISCVWEVVFILDSDLLLCYLLWFFVGGFYSDSFVYD